MDKKNIKWIGNVFTILAIVFLIKKMLSINVEYSSLLTTSNIFYLTVFSTLYGFHIYMVCISWKTIVYIITQKKVKFSSASLVLCKANLLKYIPGNVFQYVGRNDLAVKEDLKHADVALATMIDIIMNILGVFFLAVLCYSSGAIILLEEYGTNLLKAGLVLLFIVIIAVGIIYRFFKAKCKQFIFKIRVFFTKKNILYIIACLMYYFFWGIFTGFIFIGVLTQIVGISLDFHQSRIILGAFLLSWILGFIMPGAPGGIGIREASLTLMLNSFSNVESILFGIVIYRIVNVFGDLIGLLFARITCICVENKE